MRINDMKWNKIEGYNHDLAGFANRDNGVNMPDVGRLVVLLSDDRKRFYFAIAHNESIDGTRYHDGMIWAYLNPPKEYEGR